MFCRNADSPLEDAESSANFFPARTFVYSETLELEPQHELQLSWQSGAGVGAKAVHSICD